MAKTDIAGYALKHPGETEIYEALKKFHKGLTPEQMRELRGLYEHINEQSLKGASREDLKHTRTAIASNILSIGTVRWEAMRRDAEAFAGIHMSQRKMGLGHGHNEPQRPVR